MSKKDNQSVIIEPNVFAAMNPGYGVGSNVVSGSTISGPVVGTPMGNAVVKKLAEILGDDNKEKMVKNNQLMTEMWENK